MTSRDLERSRSRPEISED